LSWGLKLDGLFPRSVEIITHLLIMGSFLNSGTAYSVYCRLIMKENYCSCSASNSAVPMVVTLNRVKGDIYLKKRDSFRRLS